MHKSTLFFVISFIFVYTSSHASAWLEESKAFGAWDLMPAFEAGLQSQRLEFKLENDRYQADVYYQLKPLLDSPLKGKVVFPMLCVQSINSKAGDIDKVSAPCVHDFELSINETVVEVEKIDIREVSDVGYLLYDHQTIREISKLAARAYPESGVQNPLAGNRIKLRLYVFEVEEAVAGLEVHIRYTAPYYYYISGSNESPFDYYSNDTLFYGLSSASRWAGEEIDQVSVTIDASNVFGGIDFSEGLKFKLENGVYTFQDEKVKLRKLKPVVLALNRRHQKQYQKFLSNQSRVKQEVVIKDVNKEQADMSVLLDRDMKTAWCQDGRTAHLKIRLKKPEEDSLCLFNGLGVINGYAESVETLNNYGKAKSANYTVLGTEKFSQDAKALKYTYRSILKNSNVKGRWNPYRTTRYFTRSRNNENFLEQTIEVALQEGDGEDVELNESIEIDVEILDIYKGVAENVCISEIIPLYHCY